MAIQIEELLKLPIEERRLIAEQILNSISIEEENEFDEATIKMLNNRIEKIDNNEAILLSQEQFDLLLANRRKGA